MTAVWITIAALAVGTAATKIASVLVLGAHPLGERALAVTVLAAPTLLAALIVYETLGDHGRGIVVDARVAGLAAAVAAIALRRSMIVVVLVAAAAAALVRAVT